LVGRIAAGRKRVQRHQRERKVQKLGTKCPAVRWEGSPGREPQGRVQAQGAKHKESS